MQIPSRTERRGFTLIEAALAAVVLSISLTVILGSLAQFGAAGAELHRSAKAYDIAADRLNYAAQAAGALSTDSGNVDAEGISYQWQMERSAAPNAGIVKLVCTVSWRRSGEESQVSLTRGVLATNEQDGG